ncbi:MAG: LamG-like jellyroll fold domain-containing protein [Bacteroidota bacterium]
MKRNPILSLLAFFLTALNATGFAQNLPAYVPANGLIGWYPFTGNADDSSGNGNHATVNGAVLASDRFGNSNAAYSFNGSTDYLQGNASTFPTAYRTVSIWFYSNIINTVPTGMQVFGYGGGLCEQSLLMQMDNPNFFTSFFTENTYEVAVGCNTWLTALPFGANGTPPSPNSNWQHWVITNSQSGLDLYINGNYAGGITTPIAGTVVAGKKFFIGACPDSSGMIPFQDPYLTRWNGILDDIGIWNRALTQQEITALFNGGTVGIGDGSNDPSYSVHPNPTNDAIHIKVDERSVGSTFTVIDSYGKTVISDRILESDFRLELQDLPSGMYLLHTGVETDRYIRIIKQ